MDEFDQKIYDFEVKAKRFGSVKPDLDLRLLSAGFKMFERHRILRANKPDLCVIGARPGTGKTSFLVQVLRNVAKSGAGDTMIFSLEMAHDQLVLRALAAEVGAPVHKLAFIPEQRVDAAMNRLNDEPVFVDDTSGVGINVIRARALDYNKRKPLSVIGVDYLQIVGADGESKRDKIGEIAKGLKQLAKDLNIPVIALAQMNREYEKRLAQSKHATPMMSDLQECSLVENWADQIVFLSGAGRKDPSRDGQVDVHIAKNRHGPMGDFILAFDGETTRFSDFEGDSL